MKFNIEKFDLNKIDPDALFILIEILDKIDVNIFDLQINENMTGPQAGKIIMKSLIFKLHKVKEELYDLMELVAGERPKSVGEILEIVASIMGVEDFKDFFTSVD